jgi:AFG3 family protein
MASRFPALRRLSLAPTYARTLPIAAVRRYAAPTQPPKPSGGNPNPSPPAGLESLFGPGSPQEGTTVAPKPAGTGPPSEPSQPKKPDVGLPGLEGEAEDKPFKERRNPKLSEAGKRVGTGGGGGGGGSGGSGGPGGQIPGGMTPNQLLLAVIR